MCAELLLGFGIHNFSGIMHARIKPDQLGVAIMHTTRLVDTVVNNAHFPTGVQHCPNKLEVHLGFMHISTKAIKYELGCFLSAHKCVSI